MLKIKTIVVALVMAFGLSGCFWSSQKAAEILPPSRFVSAQGSLADASLTVDIESLIASSLGSTLSAAPMPQFSKFVVEFPTGKPQHIAWKEIWVYNASAQPRRFLVSFQQRGKKPTRFEVVALKD